MFPSHDFTLIHQILKQNLATSLCVYKRKYRLGIYFKGRIQLKVWTFFWFLSWKESGTSLQRIYLGISQLRNIVDTERSLVVF
jgi:hypothetical protein